MNHPSHIKDQSAFSAYTEVTCKMSDTASTTSSSSDMDQLGAVCGDFPSTQAGHDVDPKTEAEGDALDAFLAKKRCELMYEIRHLKLGEKPVTSGERRKNIDEFMTRRVEASAKAEHDLPANMDDVESHRPEAVLVEVQGLFDRRPVSSLLQSLQFRRTLENAIRHGLSSAPSLTTPQRSVVAPRDHSGSSASAFSNLIPARTVRTPSVSSRSTATSHSSRSSDGQHAASAPHEVPAPPPPPMVPLAFNSVPQPWLQQAVAESQHLEEPPIFQVGEDVARENMIAEISDLVHRQLVTSTLEGNFRAVLELRMQDHLSRTGTNGQAVLDTLQELPRTQHIQRNDFSHLGIQAPGQDNLDNISIVSASAIPYAQSNLALNREMQAVKSQLAELRNMMQLSFTMQMDIQRAIRQEVAAAMSQAGAQAAAPPVARVQTRPVSDTNCLICLDSSADAVLYQCGHLCTCYTCGINLQGRGARCPICRAPIKDIIRVYQCNTKKDAE